MKSKSKSAFITFFAMSIAGFLLAGCSDDTSIALPHVFSGLEVPQDVLDEPRLVTVPPKVDMTDQPYPRLGDVPFKPQTFSPKPVLDQAVNELEFDRKQAREAEDNYLNPPPTILPTTQPY